MSRGGVPKYRKHPNGQAFIEHFSIPNKSRRKFLGRYGTPESKRRYQLAIAQIEGIGNAPTLTPGQWPTINWLIARYLDFAKTYYLRDWGLSSEYDGMIYALSPLSKLFGPNLCATFGPKNLTAIRSHLAANGAARSSVNHTLSRIKKFWAWCCEQELAPGELYSKLQCVKGLRRGQENCYEPERIRPANMESLTLLLPFVSSVIGDMLRLQYFCAMRPGETCIMRRCDLDMSGAVWLYRPQRHKNEWRGFSEVKAIPAAARSILEPYLSLDGYLFRPARLRVPNKKIRTTIKFPSEVQRLAREAKNAARRKGGRNLYTPEMYRAAVQYGFVRAAAAGVTIEPFNPNQLRHAIGTYVSQALGQQASQRYLGHENLNTTNIYTESQLNELLAITHELDKRWSASA